MTAQTQITFPDAYAGYICPCCQSFVKIYKRHFNSNMGVSLICLYKNRDKGFVHLEELMRTQGYKRCGDASYLRHYGLIEALQEDRADGSSRNGKYRITGRGIMFVEMKLTVQEKFLMKQNKCLGFEGKEVNIKDVLGEKFDYSKLMNQ